MPPDRDREHIVLPVDICLSVCLSVWPSVCLLKTQPVNIIFSYNFHTIQVTMLILVMQVAFVNTQLVRVISSRSRSNIKVTFLKKMAVSGALVFLFLQCVEMTLNGGKG